MMDLRWRLSPLTIITVLLPWSWICYAWNLGERALPHLSASDISTLLSITDPVKNVDPQNPSSHLSKILIPRAPDTANITLVGDYIITTLKSLNWHVETDEFSDETPLGVKNFRNIIATKNPDASRRVILAAHYDSKYFPSYPNNQFVGATDSAAPCAMLLDLAEALNPFLDERQERLETEFVEDEEVAEVTLQLIFFDGEEAFKMWTHKDSLYGSRHLAEKWANTYPLPYDKRRLASQSTELSGIEHLILLDLLGAPQPRDAPKSLIRSFYLETTWLFDALRSVEKRLGEDGFFVYGNSDAMAPGKWESYFLEVHPLKNIGAIEDDHIPFIQKGVSVLHLIPQPFPRVWHNLEDDATALDVLTMRRWNLMLRVFMAEYLHLQPENARQKMKRSDCDLSAFCVA